MSEYFRFDDWFAMGLALVWSALPGLLVTAFRPVASPRLVDRVAHTAVAGIGVHVMIAAVVDVFGGSFALALRIGHGLAILGGLTGVFALWRRRGQGLRADGAGVAAAAVAVVLTVYMAVSIGPLSSGSDALDHLGTIRAVQTRGELEPNTVFYADGDGVTPDIRKGYLHAWMAEVSRVARLDPVDAWYALSVWAVSLAVLAFLPLARVLVAGRNASILALVAFPFFVHGNSHWFLDTILYPHNLNWAPIWLVLAGFVSRHLAVSPSRPMSRWWLAPLIVPLAGWHVFAPLLLVSALLTLPAGYLVAGDRSAARTALGDFAFTLLLAAPFLAWRLFDTYLPINPLHTQVNEVFFITDRLTLHSLDSTFRKFPPGVLALVALSLVVLRRGARSNRRRVALLALAWCPVLVSFNPVAGGILQPKMGYMFERFLGIIPFPALAAAIVIEARARGGVFYGWALPVVVAVLGAMVVPRWVAEADPAKRERERTTSPEGWRRGLQLITRNTDADDTVAADPVTGYGIPAYTGRRIVATLDQHSSPSDSTILHRLEDVARVFSPYRPLGEATDRLSARGAGYVFVNEAFGAPWHAYFDSRRPGPQPEVRARFEGAPDHFRLVDVDGGCALYEVLDPRGRRPPRSAKPFPGVRGGRATCESPLTDSFVLCDVEVLPPVAAPGDTVAFAITLRKTRDDSVATPYRWTLRGRRALDPDEAKFAEFDRWYSRFFSRAKGAPREFVVARRPTNGRYPPRLWDVGSVVTDTLYTRLSPDLAPGEYELGVKFRPKAFARNVALADLLAPRGGVGVSAGTLRVEARSDDGE